MKKQKVFVLVQHGNDNQDYSSVDVAGVFHTKTAAKERMQEKKDEILVFRHLIVIGIFFLVEA